MSEQIANRILVIDDESTHRILAKEYLEEAGYVVRLAEDAKRGLKLAMNSKPDLVLVDLMMPGMDGFEICQHLKAAEATAHVPVILITASRESDVIARGFEVGVDDFVTKPVDWTFIADRVGLVLAIAQKKRRDLLEKEDMARQLQSVQEQAEQEGRAFASAEVDGAAAGGIAGAGGAAGSSDSVDARIRAIRQSAEAEMQGLDARYAAQMEAQQAEARATIEAATLAARRELEGVHLAHARALSAARIEFDNALAAERETARRDVDAERQRAEQAITALKAHTDEAVRAARQDDQARIESLSGQHAADLEAQRAEVERRVRAIEAIAAAQLQSVQATKTSEIEALRAQLDQHIAQMAATPVVEKTSSDLPAILQAAHDARLRSCWDIAQNLGNTHLEMVKSLLEKVRALRDDGDAESAGGRSPNRARLIEIEKAVNALSTSLGSLRLLAYMMSGKAALDEAPCDLTRLVRETADKMKTLAAMNKVTLRAEAPDRSVAMIADEPRIAYGLLMLTMNAIRHSPHGATVTLSVEDDAADGVQIKVTDQGVGIPQVRLGTLRTCLDQPLDFADEQKFGFGIPIATAIARLHGGSLELDSILGGGTVAAIRLPNARRSSDQSLRVDHRRSA